MTIEDEGHNKSDDIIFEDTMELVEFGELLGTSGIGGVVFEQVGEKPNLDDL